MNKIILALFIFILTSCSNIKKDQISSIELQNNKIENEELIKDEFDFRQAKWGMSSKEILQIEIDKELVETNNGEIIAFYDEILGYTFLVIYKLTYDKFYEGTYNLMNNENRFYELKKSLELKYGKAKEEIKDEKALWETKTTIINLYRKKNNKAIAISYLSKEYQENIKNTKLQEELKNKKIEQKINKNIDEVKEKF